MPKQYGYNPETMTYFQRIGDHETAVPASSIKRDVNRFAQGVQSRLRDLTNQMLTNQIGAQQWYDESARLLKLSYRATADVSRGGGEMTEEDRKRWLALALTLLLLLNRAAEDINRRIFPMDGRLSAYIGSLGAANNGLYENWRLTMAKNLGYTEGMRKLTPADHCHNSSDRPGCVELAALGWVPIEKVVWLGAATCRRHCKCEMHFRGKKSGLLVTQVISPFSL